MLRAIYSVPGTYLRLAAWGKREDLEGRVDAGREVEERDEATCKMHLSWTWTDSPKERMVNLMPPGAASDGGTNTPFQFKEGTKGTRATSGR